MHRDPPRHCFCQQPFDEIAPFGPVNRAHRDFGFEPVSDHGFCESCSQRFDVVGDTVGGDIEPLDRHAHLTARHKGGIKNPASEISAHLHVRTHDRRVVAPELENDGTHRPRRSRITA